MFGNSSSHQVTITQSSLGAQELQPGRFSLTHGTVGDLSRVVEEAEIHPVDGFPRFLIRQLAPAGGKSNKTPGERAAKRFPQLGERHSWGTAGNVGFDAIDEALAGEFWPMIKPSSLPAGSREREAAPTNSSGYLGSTHCHLAVIPHSRNTTISSHNIHLNTFLLLMWGKKTTTSCLDPKANPGGKDFRYFALEQEPKYKGGIQMFENSRNISESNDSWGGKKTKQEKKRATSQLKFQLCKQSQTAEPSVTTARSCIKAPSKSRSRGRSSSTSI